MSTRSPTCSRKPAIPPRTCNAERMRPVISTRVARFRLRHPTRRLRTTAQASTAACSPIAFSAGCRRKAISPSTTRYSKQSARAVAHFLATPETELVAGIDGCSAPNYAVPLGRLALGFARLAAGEVDPVYGRAPAILGEAMTAHPEMVSGENRNDLALMRAGRGDWVAKIGAEGVQAIGVRSRGSASPSRSSTAQSAGSIRQRSRPWTRWAWSTRRNGPAVPMARTADPQLSRNRHRTRAAGACTGQGQRRGAGLDAKAE